MADEQEPTDGPESPDAVPAAARDRSGAAAPPADRPRPSPGVSAARRARRIGGAPVAPAATDRSGTRPTAGRSTAAKPSPAKPRPGEKAAPDRRTTDTASGSRRGRSRAAGAERRGRRPGPIWLPAGVLTVAAIVFALLIVTFSHSVWWSRPSPSSVRDKVLAASASCLVTVNSYDYRTIKTFQGTAHKCITGTYVKEFDKFVTSRIVPNATRLKFVQRAQIDNKAIEHISNDGHTWTVLLFGQINSTSINAPKGSQGPFAAAVIMRDVGGRWVIAHINPVTASTGAATPAPTTGSGTSTGTPTPPRAPASTR